MSMSTTTEVPRPVAGSTVRPARTSPPIRRATRLVIPVIEERLQLRKVPYVVEEILVRRDPEARDPVGHGDRATRGRQGRDRRRRRRSELAPNHRYRIGADQNDEPTRSDVRLRRARVDAFELHRRPARSGPDDEVHAQYSQVAAQLPQDQYVAAARDAFEHMSPQEREQFARELQTRAQDHGLNLPATQNVSSDPGSLASGGRRRPRSAAQRDAGDVRAGRDVLEPDRQGRAPRRDRHGGSAPHGEPPLAPCRPVSGRTGGI